MFRSLRLKIVIAIILFNMLTFAAMNFINYKTSNRQLNDQLIQISMTNLESTVSNLNAMLSMRIKEVELLSRSFPDRIGTLNEQLAFLKREAPKTNLPVKQIGIAGSDGRMTLTDGTILTVGGMQAFQKAIFGIGAFSDMMLDSQDYPVFWVMVPYYDSENRPLGVIGVALDSPRIFREQLRLRYDHFKTSSITLVDRDTNVLYDADVSLILKRNYAEDEPHARELIEQLHTREKGYGEYRLFGQTQKLFYAKLPGLNWFAVYSVAKNEFEAPLRHSVWLNMVLIALTEIVLGAVFYFMTHRSIINRLKQVVEVTQKVAAGNFYPQPLQIRSSDELGALADSVNGMIDNLQELFEPFQAFIRHNQYAMIVTDAEFSITSFNQRAEQMLGYDEQEIIGRKTLLLWHDREQIRERAAFYSKKLEIPIDSDESVLFLLARKDFLPNWEWTWIDRHGVRMLVSLNTSIIRHPDGTIKGYVLIARDISEIKQATAMNTRLLEITESAHDMIASFDMHGNIFYLNRAGHAFLGISTLNELNNQLNQYMGLPLTAEFAEGLSEARQHGYWQSEIDLINAAGIVQAASITVVAHRSKDDREIFYSTIVRDISEQKETQKLLLQAKEAAVRANEAKSSFLARMSHEIRTPLNGIIGLTHLLRRSELTEIQADYLRQIADSSHNLLRILNDILDFSKLEADKLELEEAPFRLEELLQRLAGMFSVLLGPKPVDFTIHADPQIPEWLIGDPTRLEQILLNLGSNAIKFTNIGLIELEIILLAVKDDRAHLQFRVRDTGIGMTEEQRDKLFKPFVQADEKTSRKYGGTGLGLVISHTLVNRMGGTIAVESEYHVGSAFSFDLVLPIAHRVSASVKPQFPGLKVIVLEDQNRVAEHWRILLSSFGCETVALTSWEQTKVLLGESEWDVVIIDMETGDMHGEETWTEWKTALDAYGIKSISSTTLLGRDALQMLPDAIKPDAVLVKPSSSLQIQQALQVVSESSSSKSGIGANSTRSRISDTYRSIPVLTELHSRIWVVDDQIVNRLVVNQLLSAYGFEAEMMESGSEAVARAMSEPVAPDLILMDLHMPDMDGIEATAFIRERYTADQLPIIALTADVTEDMHTRCKEAGMNDIITKPIDPEVLFAVLRKHLPSLPPARAIDISGHMHEQWPEFAGLDIPLALQRLGGKSKVYLQLLDKFLQQHSQTRSRLVRFLDEGNREAATRLVHSLGGAAGHLGAIAIQEAAAALEIDLKNVQESKEAEENLFQALESGLEAIANLLRQKRG
ncbi:response regulator [Cohnella terricola]|uniref:Circadian input-output histidine kinase CikA n=1 Tax=Cohnella terricola TaxID=1289167 RepID=A0A559JQQ3_9BACL|nr:response regulator [Cohnella terricola]TVY02215.1 response regulator [Cohnella terricola]